jgi:tetratricopeptide (TPR) repeat protein
MKYGSLLIWFSFLSLSLAVAQGDDDIVSLLSQADGHIKSNELDLALDITRQALAVDPSSMDAILKEINIFYLMNDDKEAMQLVERALDEHSGEPELLYLKGIINIDRERFSRAIDDFGQALANLEAGEAYKAYLGRGISHMNLMEYEQAMSDLSRSIQLNDTMASAYHSRALLNYELKDYHAAIDDFNRALQYSEGSAVLYFNLGMSYFRLSENSNACPYFHKACTMGYTNACRMALMECAKDIPDLP